MLRHHALAGLLSLAQTRLRLPSCADQGFLALGFGLQALFLGLSPLPDEQEAKMYLLLYILVSALAVFLLVEVRMQAPGQRAVLWAAWMGLQHGVQG